MRRAGSVYCMNQPWLTTSDWPLKGEILERLHDLDAGVADGHVDGAELGYGGSKPAVELAHRPRPWRHPSLWARLCRSPRPRLELAASSGRRRPHGRPRARRFALFPGPCRSGGGDNRDLSVELHRSAPSGSGSGSVGAHAKPACSKVHVWYTRWYDEIGFRVRHHNINRNTGRRLDQRRFAIKE